MNRGDSSALFKLPGTSGGVSCGTSGDVFPGQAPPRISEDRLPGVCGGASCRPEAASSFASSDTVLSSLVAGCARPKRLLPIQFAPLQGYTDAVYRKAHARIFGGIDAYYTPFVRYEKGEFRTKDLKDIDPARNQGIRVIPQLIAATAEEFQAIARRLEAAGYCEADLNMGCPFPKQVRMRRGAGLLPRPAQVEALLQSMASFPALSFSIKLRLGWESGDEALALLPLLDTLLLRQLTLHPRLGIQQYKGKTDREGFARFLAACRHPLFYNGDLSSLEDMHAVAASFPSVAGLMLGRGLLAAPWLAWEYRQGRRLSGSEKRERLLAFHQLLAEGYASHLEGGEGQLLDKLKTLWDYLLPDADKRLRKKVVKSACLSAYHRAVRDLIGSVD